MMPSATGEKTEGQIGFLLQNQVLPFLLSPKRDMLPPYLCPSLITWYYLPWSTDVSHRFYSPYSPLLIVCPGWMVYLVNLYTLPLAYFYFIRLSVVCFHLIHWSLYFKKACVGIVFAAWTSYCPSVKPTLILEKGCWSVLLPLPGISYKITWMSESWSQWIYLK